jgi:uncharacterized membrane protein
MGNGFMLVIALCYLGAAVGYAKEKNWPMVLVALCYGTANVALVWAAKKL